MGLRKVHKQYFTAQEQAARRALITMVPLTCERCGKKFEAPASDVSEAILADFYRLRNPPPMFGLCPSCQHADQAAVRACLEARSVVCEQCGRRFIADLLSTDNRTSVPRCKECDPPERQPREGETFIALRRATDRRTGRFAGFASQRQQRSLEKHLDYTDVMEARNDNSAVREQVYSPEFVVKKAQPELEKQSVRQLAREVKTKWGISYETVRQGRTSVMQLKSSDLEIPPVPAPRPIEHKKPRKCTHGVTMHRDDRGKSRHCSACYPNMHAHLVDWKAAASDAEIVALYETGASVKVIASRLRMLQKTVLGVLLYNDVDLRPADRLAKKVTAKGISLENIRRWKRLADSVQSEEFGVVPLDPQNLVNDKGQHNQ